MTIRPVSKPGTENETLAARFKLSYIHTIQRMSLNATDHSTVKERITFIFS